MCSLLVREVREVRGEVGTASTHGSLHLSSLLPSIALTIFYLPVIVFYPAILLCVYRSGRLLFVA